MVPRAGAAIRAHRAGTVSGTSSSTEARGFDIGRRLLAPLLVGGLAAVVGGCSSESADGGSAVTTPAEWRQVALGEVVTFRLPPDASAQSTQAVDSNFAVVRGEGYEVIYDYGRYGEDRAVLAEQPGYTSRTRDVDGHPGEEVTVRANGRPWNVVRLLLVEHGRNHLTIRVSCVDQETCRMADAIFDSVRFTRGS